MLYFKTACNHLRIPKKHQKNPKIFFTQNICIFKIFYADPTQNVHNKNDDSFDSIIESARREHVEVHQCPPMPRCAR